MTTTAKQTTETKEQIKVDLDQVYNPNPKLLQVYKEKNAMDLFTDFEALRPQYVNEDRLFKIAKMSGSPIKHHIGGIYRKAIDSKEYVLWHEHLSTFDYYKNPTDHTRFMGRYEIPNIVTRYTIPATIRSDIGKLEAEELPAEINGYETQYEYEFNALKWQLCQWYEKDKIITDETRFYYWASDGTKYPVRSFDEFVNMNGDDLMLLGRSGNKLSGVFKSEERAAMLESLRAQIKEEMKTGFFDKKS